MPTVCEIKVELKSKGIKGISGLNKAGLQSLLNQPFKKVEPKSARGTPPAVAPKSARGTSPAKDKLYNKAEKFLNKMDKEMTKPKPFTPAATKGESPKIAEKKITKKARIVKPLMITYKEPSEEKAETKAKPPPKLKRPKQTEDERIDMLTTKTQATKCLKLMKQAGLKTQADLRKYIITNHPDKVKNYDPNSKAAILYRELSSCSTAFKNMKNYLTEGLIKGFKGLPPEN